MDGSLRAFFSFKKEILMRFLSGWNEWNKRLVLDQKDRLGKIQSFRGVTRLLVTKNKFSFVFYSFLLWGSVTGFVYAQPMEAQEKDTANVEKNFTAEVKSSASIPKNVLERLNVGIKSILRPPAQAHSLAPAPFPGWYEVSVGNSLFYIDETARYAFLAGTVVDLVQKKNLTEKRLKAISAKIFKTLPLDLALKKVSGKGERKLVVFEDPTCPYCKQLRAELLKLDNVSLYTFVLTFRGADSEEKAKKVFCSSNPGQAWDDLLIHDQVPKNDGNCPTPLKKIADLGKKLGVEGTPAVFFSNGERINGYVGVSRLMQALDDASAQVNSDE